MAGDPPIEAAGPIALRPGRVQQRILVDTPAEVGTASKARGVRRIGVLGTKIGSVRPGGEPVVVRRRARAEVRGADTAVELAIETADIASRLTLVETKIARPEGQGQRLGDEVRIEGGISRLLLHLAQRVVKEGDTGAAHVRIIGKRPGPWFQ